MTFFTPYIHPQRGVAPLAHTAAIVLWVAMILAAAGLGWRLSTPETVQDRHLDSELLQGLVWLSQSLRSGPAAPLQAQGPVCADADTATLALRLAEIALQSGRNVHLDLQELDCSQAGAVDKAARWLLKQDRAHIRAILHSPTENLADLIARRDPFRLPGCVFLPGASAAPMDGFCANEPGWRGAQLGDLPPRSETLWANLAYYRQALRDQSPNIFRYSVAATGMDTPFAQGRHQWLTLNADVQSKAQLTAACYTGDAAACEQCPWCNTVAGADMYESARARMLGVLVVDANDGGLLAAASAHTRCYEAQYAGHALPAGCPALPTPAAERPWKLGNHALEQAAMPASLVKIPLAAGLLETGIPAASRDAMTQNWLVRSDTEAFIDTVFCKDQGFQPACAKQRLAGIQRMAAALGWNRGCDGSGAAGCGRQDLLDAGLSADLDYPVLAGRLLVGGNHAPVSVTHLRLDGFAIQACHKQGQKERWRECRGADFIDTIAELYGQGNALAAPVGIAGLLLQLAAADSGRPQAPAVHLLRQLDGREKRRPIAPFHPLAMRPETAQAIVGAMAQTHVRGTAHAACVQAAQPGGLLRCQDDKDAPLRLAGKTGTPLFPADRQTLAAWRGYCAGLRAQPQLGRLQRERIRHELARCKLAPLKWYAVMVGKPGAQGWDKVVVVLAERNWNQRSGMVDSVEDHGSNVAAEVGLALANALASPADTAWRRPVEPFAAPLAAAKPGSAGVSPAPVGVSRRVKPDK